MTKTPLTADQLRSHKGVSFIGITTPFICYNTRGEVFLTRRSRNTRDEHGRWDFGSGGAKHGQSIEENMLRELLEEYGVKPLKSTFIGHFDAFRTLDDGTPTHWLALCFANLVDPAEVRVMEPTMVDEAGWFSLDDLPEPLHSQCEANFLPRYGARLREIILLDKTT